MTFMVDGVVNSISVGEQSYFIHYSFLFDFRTEGTKTGEQNLNEGVHKSNLNSYHLTVFTYYNI